MREGPHTRGTYRPDPGRVPWPNGLSELRVGNGCSGKIGQRSSLARANFRLRPGLPRVNNPLMPAENPVTIRIWSDFV